MLERFDLATFGVFVGTGVILFLLGYFFRKLASERKLKSAEQRAKEILDEAKKQQDNKRKEVELEAKDLLYKVRSDFDKETRERRQELNILEKRLIQKEENIDRKVDILDKKEMLQLMPAFFRTIRNKKPTKEELDTLMNLIKNA